MVILKRKFLSVGQAWFASPDGVSFENTKCLDAIEYIQSPVPIEASYQPSEFHTLAIDLTQNEEEIKKRIHKDTIYEIRRSQREQLQYLNWNEVSAKVLTEFCDFYDEFAGQKKRGKIGRALLSSYAKQKKLQLSCVNDAGGRTLTWHAHFYDFGRARLLQSASHYRSATQASTRALVGRANRYHHWEDLMSFKKMNLTTYDFGGWYAGNSDPEKLKINRFKEEFGGILRKEFNGFKVLSQKGRLYYLLKSFVESLV